MFVKLDQQALWSFRQFFKYLLFYIYIYIYIYIYYYYYYYYFYSLHKIMVAHIIVLI